MCSEADHTSAHRVRTMLFQAGHTNNWLEFLRKGNM